MSERCQPAQSGTYRTQAVQLQAADRLVLVTDGVLEAGAPDPSLLRTGCTPPRLADWQGMIGR